MEIIHINGHYEAYLNGVFICSGDKRIEVEKDAEEILAEREMM